MRYSYLRDGDKICKYPMKTPQGEIDTFSFKQDEFPIEFAPEIDYDLMFYKSILQGKMNPFYKVLYNREIPQSLKTHKTIF